MLYHRDLGFPSTLVLNDLYYRLVTYSQHALRASKEDRYGDINLPKIVMFGIKDIIEVETNDNINVQKVLVRIPYSDDFDLCLVILLENSLVKTVWLNSVDDKHFTLVKEKYTKLLV